VIEALVVGLGNPGREYARTRHNVGEEVVAVLARRVGDALKLGRDKAMVTETRFGDKRVVLAFPTTYMNLSGEAVRAAMNFYRIAPQRVMVIVDDADLLFGEIRLRARGSSGGHHGLDSIAGHLGTTEFARLKIGIGRRREGRREISGYVLSPFDAGEKVLLEKVLKRAADQTECWLAEGVDRAMNKFNGAVEPSVQ